MARLARLAVVSVSHHASAKISIAILVPICYRYSSSVRASVPEGASVARLPLLLFDNRILPATHSSNLVADIPPTVAAHFPAFAPGIPPGSLIHVLFMHMCQLFPQLPKNHRVNQNGGGGSPPRRLARSPERSFLHFLYLLPLLCLFYLLYLLSFDIHTRWVPLNPFILIFMRKYTGGGPPPFGRSQLSTISCKLLLLTTIAEGHPQPLYFHNDAKTPGAPPHSLHHPTKQTTYPRT